MNALRLFASRSRTPTPIKSPTITECLLVRSRKQYPSGRTAEGIYPFGREMGLAEPQSSPYQSAASSIAEITQHVS